MKKLLILFFLLIFILPLGVSADMGVVINFFFSPTCPHCADEVKFLDQLENKYPALTVDRFDLTKKENIDLVQIFYNKYQVPEEEYGLTPATFIELDDTRGKYFIGYSESIDKVVTDYLDSLFNNNTNNTSTQIVNNNSSGKISIPFIGKIEMTSFSPLFLSLYHM